MNLKVLVYRRGLTNAHHFSLNSDASNELSCEEIVFNYRELKIRPSSFDDTKTFKLTKQIRTYKGVKTDTGFSCFSASYLGEKNITGTYFLDKRGDWYYLIKS